MESFPNYEVECAKWQMFTLFHVLPQSVALKCWQGYFTPFPYVVNAIKAGLKLRYKLLPYLYTLFFHGWMEGEAIMRHLFYEYNWKNHDIAMMDVDDQFFWGSAVMFIPHLTVNNTRTAYFPYDTFYCLKTGKVRKRLKRIIFTPLFYHVVRVSEKYATDYAE